MIAEALSWLMGLLAMGVVGGSSSLSPSLIQVAFWIVILLADLLISLIKSKEEPTRVSPLIALCIVLYEPTSILWVQIPVLLGGIVLVRSAARGTNMANAGLGSSLAPLWAASLVRSFYGDSLPELLLVTAVFVVVSAFVVPRDAGLRIPTLPLLCTPGLAIASLSMLEQNSLYLLSLLPFLAIISLGRDELLPAHSKLQKALSASHGKLKQQHQKIAKYSKILTAAQMMSTQLEEKDLRVALRKSLKTCGIDGSIGTTESSSPAIPLTERESLSLSDQSTEQQFTIAKILCRIYGDCLRKVELHQQVLDALEETKRSQAQTLASTRLAAIGRLAAGIAHEINTPVGAIVLSSELGERLLSGAPDKAADQFRQIRLATETVQESVKRLLQYSQPDRYDEKGWFQVLPVINDSLKLNRFHQKRSRAQIDIAVPENFELFGREYDFYLLYSNLIVNSLYACNEVDSPRVEAKGGLQSDGSFLLEVRDNGPGIPAELADKIFQPFFTTKPSGEGNGLGLFLASQAAESLGASIRYKQGTNGGALFQIRFPAGSFKLT